MSYQCVCEPMEGEHCSFWTEQTRTARIAHRCSECLEVIAPKEKYVRIAGSCDGNMFSAKQCLFCAAEYKRLCSEYGIALGEVACALVAELRGEL